eukprot:Rhum_TRINITY_DN14246_c6_g1::Rhum_TRINITY_DN14246_c6_g1_i1::g.75715::m.75715
MATTAAHVLRHERVRLSVKALDVVQASTVPGVRVGLASAATLRGLLSDGTGAPGAAGPGFAALYCRDGAVSWNENCDSTVRSDMLEALRRLASQGAGGGSAAEVFDLVGRCVTLPLGAGGRAALGTWQGLYVFFAAGATAVDLSVAVAAGGGTAATRTVIDADARASHDVTEAVRNKASAGCVCVVHTHHTSASMCLRDEALLPRDLEPLLRRVVPDAWNDDFFEHTYEGRDDMPGHMKSTLVGCGFAADAALDRRFLLNEHRDCGGHGCGHARTVTCVAAPYDPRRLLRIEVQASGTLTDVTAALFAAVTADASFDAKVAYVAPADAGCRVCLLGSDEPEALFSGLSAEAAPLPAVAFGTTLLVPADALAQPSVTDSLQGAPRVYLHAGATAQRSLGLRVVLFG